MREVIVAYPTLYPAALLVPARYERNMGRLLLYAGQPERAMPHLLVSHDMFQRLYGDQHWSVAGALLELAKAHAHAGQLEQAQARFDQYLALPPLQEADGRANEAEVRAVIAAKRGNIGEALLRYVEMEKFNLEAMKPKGTRYWLSMLPRAELLAARNLAADRVRSRQLASEILAKVSSVLSADAPIVARLKKLQAP